MKVANLVILVDYTTWKGSSSSLPSYEANPEVGVSASMPQCGCMCREDPDTRSALEIRHIERKDGKAHTGGQTPIKAISMIPCESWQSCDSRWCDSLICNRSPFGEERELVQLNQGQVKWAYSGQFVLTTRAEKTRHGAGPDPGTYIPLI